MNLHPQAGHPASDGPLTDIDALADALQKIARGEFEGVYVHDPSSGDYVPLSARSPALAN